MTVTPYSDRAVLRAVLTVGTVAVLCSGLVACSSSSTHPALPVGASDTPAVAGSASTTDTAPPVGASDTAPPVGASDTAPPVGASDTASSAAADQSGPPAAPVGGADATHPCALITRAEAASAMGQPLTSGSQIPAMGMCDYSTPDFSTGVGITVSSWDSITAAAHSSGHTPPAVSGVGDEAYFGVGLSVRKGDKGFLLTMGGPVIDKLSDRGLAKEKALAALVLGRL